MKKGGRRDATLTNWGDINWSADNHQIQEEDEENDYQ